mmetsp:Transcript_51509/g.144004  ORF Transcript_51509/g.144004 Transcript_51509/m.144004 type:complete len:138 (+) Transcript_51509:2-415(+)
MGGYGLEGEVEVEVDMGGGAEVKVEAGLEADHTPSATDTEVVHEGENTAPSELDETGKPEVMDESDGADVDVEVVEELLVEDETARAAAEAAEEFWRQRMQVDGASEELEAAVSNPKGGPGEIYVTTTLFEGLSGVA